MNRYTTQGIVLTRTDFAEADRILTFLTSDHGKVRGLAKGVRKTKSKLAGGLELFSVSDLTMLIGRGEINTIMSTRLIKHYGDIVKDLKRTELAYESLRLIHKATEDAPEPAYYELLNSTLEALNDSKLEPQVTFLWFSMQLLKLSGHSPNLKTDIAGNKLTASASYDFYLDKMHFSPKKTKAGKFKADDIKFLRIGFAAERPQTLKRIENSEKLLAAAQPLLQTMLQSFVQI
jgi:DNA repair protein RecO (recombination protein O)